MPKFSLPRGGVAQHPACIRRLDAISGGGSAAPGRHAPCSRHGRQPPGSSKARPFKPSSAATPRPTVDEWGIYDPQQAGLAALFTRLAAAPASGGAAPRDTGAARVLPDRAPRPGATID